MPDSIHCQYQLTLDEHQAAHHWAIRHTPRTRYFIWCVWGAGAVLLLAGAVRTANQFLDAKTMFCFACGLALLLTRLMRRRLVRRLFLQSPQRDQTITWEISPERLIVATPSTRFEADWTTVTRVVRIQTGFLLFSGPFARWLPGIAFANAADQEQLARWAAERCSKFEDCRS